jgi:hypothetical protein
MLQARCFGLHEADDVGSNEPMKLDFAFAEDLSKESSNRIAVQTNGSCGETSLADQILIEGQSSALRRRDYSGRRCRHIVLSHVGTKSSKSIECVSITASAPQVQPSMVKVLASVARCHAGGIDLALLKPSHRSRQPTASTS